MSNCSKKLYHIHQQHLGSITVYYLYQSIMTDCTRVTSERADTCHSGHCGQQRKRWHTLHHYTITINEELHNIQKHRKQMYSYVNGPKHAQRCKQPLKPQRCLAAVYQEGSWHVGQSLCSNVESRFICTQNRDISDCVSQKVDENVLF